MGRLYRGWRSRIWLLSRVHGQLDDILSKLHSISAEVSVPWRSVPLRKVHVMQVLGSASRCWGGRTRMDLLDVEGMVSLHAPKWRNFSDYVHRRRARTNGAIRRVLRAVGFHKILRNDCIQDSVMARACDVISFDTRDCADYAAMDSARPHT